MGRGVRTGVSGRPLGRPKPREMTRDAVPGFVIDNRGGEAMFTDGPFLESKEYLAGFWIMDAPDLDVALKLAAEGAKACSRKVEVRPFL